MPLWKYLEWLQETPEGTVGGKPLYLAQWVGREQVKTPSNDVDARITTTLSFRWKQ